MPPFGAGSGKAGWLCQHRATAKLAWRDRRPRMLRTGVRAATGG